MTEFNFPTREVQPLSTNNEQQVVIIYGTDEIVFNYSEYNGKTYRDLMVSQQASLVGLKYDSEQVTLRRESVRRGVSPLVDVYDLAEIRYLLLQV